MASTDTQTARITMPCDIESRRPAHRQPTWHADCPRPETCPCPAHQRDEPDAR